MDSKYALTFIRFTNVQKTIPNFLRIQETKQPSLNPLQNRVSPSWDPI